MCEKEREKEREGERERRRKREKEKEREGGGESVGEVYGQAVIPVFTHSTLKKANSISSPFSLQT